MADLSQGRGHGRNVRLPPLKLEQVDLQSLLEEEAAAPGDKPGDGKKKTLKIIKFNKSHPTAVVPGPKSTANDHHATAHKKKKIKSDPDTVAKLQGIYNGEGYASKGKLGETQIVSNMHSQRSEQASQAEVLNRSQQSQSILKKQSSDQSETNKKLIVKKIKQNQVSGKGQVGAQPSGQHQHHIDLLSQSN